ncbi:MAG: 2-oxo acid dehydrogenase subunit E2, partial [Planctomycetes bacterium]|nr:2-oxo acid dehydrogenase subunit E2 [Planctomycetota bacterium]
FGVNAGYVEKVYHDFMAAPSSVGAEWRRFFEEHGLQAPPEPEPRAAAQAAAALATEHGDELLRGVAARIVTNMEESLSIPTATSTRVVPVKVLEENRRIINQHLALEYRGKASFTHLIAFAMVRALAEMPALTVSFRRVDGAPHRHTPDTINLGVAVDATNRDGSRGLVVPNIRNAGALDFGGFLAAYNELIAKARSGGLTPDDFKETTCTLTNPGMIGTVSSLPRLMSGQSFILATGAITVPAEFLGAAETTLSELGISKVMTLTSTYDHRVIQGAVSGEFLQRMHEMLAGQDEFYAQIFRDLAIPHRPLFFVRDRRAAMGTPMRENEQMERAARVMQYIRAYRVRGYLLADLDPLEYEPKSFPELELSTYGLSIWDLDREFFTSGVTGKPMATLRDIREVLRTTYCAKVGAEFMHIADPQQKDWLRERMESTRNRAELSNETQLRVLDRLIEAEAFERFLHTKFVGHKRFSLEGAETLIPTLDALLAKCAADGVDKVVLGMAHRGRLNVLA